MKVIFIREYKSEDGVEYRPGTVHEVSGDVAKQLIDKGFARERRENREPVETKYEREDEVEDEGDSPDDYEKKEKT